MDQEGRNFGLTRIQGAKYVDSFHSGGCQCGKVRYRVNSLLDNGHACFCRMCQKATGSLVSFWVSTPLSGLTWTRKTPDSFYSSEMVERGFCSNCGTTLTFRREGKPLISLSISSLDHPEKVALKFNWGVESRACQFDQMNDVPNHNSDLDFVVSESVQATSNQHPDYET